MSTVGDDVTTTTRVEPPFDLIAMFAFVVIVAVVVVVVVASEQREKLDTRGECEVIERAEEGIEERRSFHFLVCLTRLRGDLALETRGPTPGGEEPTT